MGGHGERSRRILLVDDDQDLVDVVTAALVNEGYEVVVPDGLRPDQVERAVNGYEPDCVLLDSASRTEYGASWKTAARLRRRDRPVPTVMFTAHAAAGDEAEEKESDRARAAGFVAVLRKPFGLDDLLSVVGKASADSTPFESPSLNGPERLISA